MDDAEVEWRAHGTQIRRIEVDAKKNHQEVLSTTNQIKDAILKNTWIFGEKWESTHDRIDCQVEEHLLLKTRVVELESLSGLQQNTFQHCQDMIAGLEETVAQLVASVKKLEKTICRCHDRLLSPGPHYAPGEEEAVVGDSEEEEEDGLEYKTDAPSRDSYMTLPSTRGHSKPSPCPSQSLTLENSDPETNSVLQTVELEAHIESFLEEAEEDMELDDLPPLENITPLPVPAPVVPSFVPFAVSTSQHCVPPKSLLWKVYHPYHSLVGQCSCEPGGWCTDLPCSSWKRLIPQKVQGHSSLNGGSRLRRSCCGTSEEPCDQSGSSHSQHTPTHVLCLGSPEL